MPDSLNDSIRRHLADNIWIYLIVIFSFILGISLGALAVNNIDEAAKTDAIIYLEGFLDLTNQNQLQSEAILKQSIKYNFYYAMILFFSGAVYIGIIVIPMLVAFRGFCIGFSIAFLTKNVGSNGFLLSLGSVLPQNLIFVPVIIVMGVTGFNYSLWALRYKYFKKSAVVPRIFAAYALSMLVLFILLVAGSIVEAYITSLIVRAIVPYIKY
ncbi:MAG TPA: stage II sporulation protein M [Bacillota bacterium]|nr:stage II sporulation protein M [Bacillota bacterium]HRU40740.1 stage II sporulation protein M [Candidatus Diapherotrites archaeon]HQE66011.1 stage II sporulation protein M [Bacillota bacterium]HQI16773.1 stage II sporulation protein M [Bacillota bacterium]HQJ36244.1 stage II sporulation protein M [Bacillota bacterium]